jgi:hypothetical protein
VHQQRISGNRNAFVSIPDHQHHGDQPAITLSRNPELHNRKHFNEKFHYQWAVLNAGEISNTFLLKNKPLTVSLRPWGLRPAAFAKFYSLLGIEFSEIHNENA